MCGSLGRGWQDSLPTSVPGQGLVCVWRGVLGGVVGVLLWRKASAHPILFSEKVVSPVNSKALPIVASLRHLIPET